MHRTGFSTGPHEMARLQALGKQTHAVATPPEDLQAVAATASKDEDMAAEGIGLELIVHNGSQAVKATAHIGHPGSQPHPSAGGQTHHCKASISSKRPALTVLKASSG